MKSQKYKFFIFAFVCMTAAEPHTHAHRQAHTQAHRRTDKSKYIAHVKRNVNASWGAAQKPTLALPCSGV